MKIVISEHVHDDAVTRLRDRHPVHYDPELHADRRALAAALDDAAALMTRNRTRVDDALLADAPALRVVGRVGVGLDNFDLSALRRRGVTVTWAPGTNAVSVAEYVLGALLELCRRFGPISQQLHGGGWDRQSAIGTELAGKRLGIIGGGDIGSRLARRARALGMAVLISDPVLHPSSFVVQEYEATLSDLETLLAEADAVSLHVPLLPSTRHLIDAAALARMKPTALLVNTARGGLVDEAALAAALRGGRLAGAALDVREQEPPPPDDPLRGLPNVLLTPHVAGVTHEALRRASLHVADDVLRVLAGKPPLSPAPGG